MTFDLNGNLETATEGGQTTTFAWDARSRLTGIAGPGPVASFAYDAAGRRVGKVVGGFSTSLQYDRFDVVREIAGGATVTYLRGLAIDEPLARIEDTSTACYLTDVLGSSLALTDASGRVVTEYTYEPFGRSRESGIASPNAFQFTGRENDGTGLYYYRMRWYNPTTARFVQEDPLGVWGTVDPYLYAENSPTGSTDPLGLQGQPPGVFPPGQNPAVPGQSGGRDPTGLINYGHELLLQRLGGAGLTIVSHRLEEISMTVDCGKSFFYWVCWKKPRRPALSPDIGSIRVYTREPYVDIAITDCWRLIGVGTKNCCPPGQLRPPEAPALRSQ
jgi:RHS repeat-associated protein